MELRLGDTIVDFGRHEARRSDAIVKLTPNEVKLLSYLAANPGRVISREELLTKAWGYRAGVHSRTVDTTIRRVRAKVEGASDARHVVTVFGAGYRLDLFGGASASVWSEEPLEPGERSLRGRGDDLVALNQALASARLVTVTGPGGVGKTRLARRLLALRGRAEDLFCSVAEARDGAGVLAALADALGVATGLESVGEALRGCSLVVLDNLEQALPDAAPTLEALCQAAVSCVFLATSRSAAGVDDEREYPLDGLSTEAAVALFVDRARHARPRFEAEDLARITALVVALDRLPLAIELAAGRMNLLSVAELVERLPGQIELLRSADGRGSTLAATVQWSWDLMSADLQAVVAQLSVFRGGFSMDAAEAVVDATTVLEAVEEAARRNLLQLHPQGGPGGASRGQLFESVRAFARVHQGPGARERHAAWFGGRARQWFAVWSRDGFGRVSELLAAEAANLSAALEYATGADRGWLSLVVALRLRHLGQHQEATTTIDAALAEPDLSLELAANLNAAAVDVLRVQGRGADAVARVRPWLADAPPLPDLEAGTLWLAVSCAALEMGGMALASSAADKAQQAAQRIGATRVLMGALGNKASALRASSRLHDAIEVVMDAVSLSDAGAPVQQGLLLVNLGGMWLEAGRPDRALPHLDRAAAVGHDWEIPRVQAAALGNKGAVLLEIGRHDEATAALHEAARLARGLKDRRTEALAGLNIAGITQEQGRFSEALAQYEAALAILVKLDLYSAAFGRLQAGAAYHEAGWAARALELYGEARQVFEAVGDIRSAGVVAARLIALHASAGRIEEAEASQAAARAAVGEDPCERVALDLLEAHLPLARGESTGAARLALAAAEGPRPDLAAPSAAAWSADVRFAARLLRAAVRARSGL